MHPATSNYIYVQQNVAFLQSYEDHTSFYCERLRQNMSSFLTIFLELMHTLLLICDGINEYDS